MDYHLAFITGATSGIGWAVAELLASKAIPLVISGRNQEQLHLLQAKLSKQVEVESLEADLSLPKGREKLVSFLHRRVPDLVINNAGFGLYGEALTHATNDQVDILEVNGKAVLELTIEAARALVSKEKKGIILNVSSAAAFQIFPTMAVYGASKALVNHFSQALDFEVRKYGIRVLTMCPGMVMTDFQKRAGGQNLQHTGAMSPIFVAEQIWKQIKQLKPLKIIDWKYRLLTHLSHFFPTSWIASIEERIIMKRINPRTLIKI